MATGSRTHLFSAVVLLLAVGGDAARQASHSERSEAVLRHYTPELGCIDPNYVAPPPMQVDSCVESFKTPMSSQFCSDPYLGGDPTCCIDPLNTSHCSTCYGFNTCDAASLKCAEAHLHSCGPNIVNVTENMTASFHERRDTCVFGTGAAPGMAGYWRHPGYVLQGTLVQSGVATRITSLEDCAAKCNDMGNFCNAFTWTSRDRICRLQEAEINGVCDLGETLSANGLTMIKNDESCTDPGVETYYRDEGHMYCGSEALQCACHREYYYCMQSYGCASSKEEEEEYGELCITQGCTAQQCGIEKPSCNVTQATCVNEYFVCSWAGAAGSKEQCGCTRQYIECLLAGDCPLTQERDPISGFTAFDLCTAENCTAMECGLPEQVCNATSLPCSHDFLACASGAQGDVFWDRTKTGGFQQLPSGRVQGPAFDEEGYEIWWPVLQPGVFASSLGTRGVYAGKYYWEVRVSGQCVLVGVALPSLDPRRYPGYGDDGWAFGDLGFGGELFNNAARSYGQSIRGETVISVALDARQGLVWFANNGRWMSGNPATGTTPAFTITGVNELHPAVGAAPGCGDNITIYANFGQEDFQYSIPNGFVQLRSDECTCTGSFMHCMEATGCTNEVDNEKLLASCLERGCDAAACGLPDFLPTPWLCDSEVPVECAQEYAECAAHAPSECACTAAKMKCMADHGCHIAPDSLAEYGRLCALRGCTAQQCGLCEPVCNVTSLQCSETFLACTSASLEPRTEPGPNGTLVVILPGPEDERKQYCECAAAYHGCMEEGNCITEEISSTHSQMCADHGCTALECGIPDALQTCNQTNLLCSERFVACQGERLNPSRDRCNLNYGNSGRGAEFCYNPVFGGIYGCRFDEDTQRCYTSEDCACAEEYFVCMRDGCVSDEEINGYMSECVELGCTAEQCGLSYFQCNQTSLVCANEFMSCEFSQLDAEEDAATPGPDEDAVEEQEELPWCSRSFCIRNYYQCMDAANCITEDALRQHIALCFESNCTLAECGIQAPGEEKRDPDAPTNLRLRSLLNNRIQATWSNSPLAVLWSQQGSINVVIQYTATLFGGCVSQSAGTQFEVVCADKLVNQTVVVGQAANSVVFADLGLVIGDLYQVQVTALNINGTGPPATASMVLAGPPKEPQNVRAVPAQGQPLSATALWEKPLDTGDLTPNYPLTRYTVRVTANPLASAVTVDVGAAIRSRTFSAFVGGTWRTCVNQGQTCTCVGAVRLGNSGQWSPPAAVQGSIACEVSEALPDVLVGQTKRCQCNSGAQLLLPGQNFSAAVRAQNDVGAGPYTEEAQVRVMGYPSKVRQMSSVELDDRVELAWAPPLDRGYGSGDTTVEILSYTILLSECSNFDRTATACAGLGVRSFELPAAECGAANCTFALPEAGNFVQGSIYWLRVVAQNPVGFGWASSAPPVRVPWKVVPLFTFPSQLVGTPPRGVRVADWFGNRRAWIGSTAVETVAMQIRHLPFTTLQQELAVTVTLDGVDYFPVATVTARSLGSSDAFLDDALGIDVITSLSLELPAIPTLGTATAVLATPERPDKSITFTLTYFEYPKPTIDFIFPVDGPFGGGNVIRVEVVEETGAETREGAGLPNFVDTPASSVRVVFNNTRQSTQITKSLIASDRAEFRIVVPNSGFTVEGNVPLHLFIDSQRMELSSPVTYKYRGPIIASMDPSPDSLTTGGQDFQLIVVDVGLINIVSVTIAMNDRAATNVVAQPPTVESLVLTGTTPRSPPDNAAGPVTIVLTLVTTTGTIRITDTDKHTFVVPPDPEFVESSLEVPLRPGQNWAATTLSTEVRFSVKFLGPQTSLSVKFGTYNAASVSWTDNSAEVPANRQNDVRFYTTEIVAFTPRNTQIPEGFVSITVSAGGLTAQSTATSFQFVDLTQPRVNTALPSESRLSGGSIMRVGISGFCKGTTRSDGTCSPSSFSADFTVNGVSTAAQVYGYVSLASWLARDSVYDNLVGNSELSTFNAGIGQPYRAVLDTVVNNLESNAATANDGVTSNDNSFIILLKTPAAATATDTASLTITANAASNSGINGNSFTLDGFSYVADPSGAAVIVSRSLEEGTRQQSEPLTITLENFLMVYFTSEVSVVFGAEPVLVTRIEFTSSQRTTLYLFTPQANVGTFDVTVQPTALVANGAQFSFTVVDDREPEVVLGFPRPDLVYSSGGDTVEVRINYLGDASTTAAQLSISVLFGSSPVAVTSGITVSYDAVQERLTVTFPAPAGSAGTATVTVANTVTNDQAAFLLEYRAVPTGDATIVLLDPSEGSTNGGEEVFILLESFRRVSAISQLTVRFGSTTVPAADISELQSNIEFTRFKVNTPATSVGGTVNVRVTPSQDSSNVGSASFNYIDFNQAILLQADPTQGDAESTTLINIGLGRLGRTIDNPTNLDVSVSGINGLTVTVASVGADSTVDRTNIVLSVPPSPTVIQTATTISISIRPTGAGALKTVTFDFVYLPPGTARVTFFSPNEYIVDGGVSMSIEAANFPSSFPRITKDAIKIVFDQVTNVTADSLTFTDNQEPRTQVIITCTIPPALVAGAVTPRLYAPSVFVNVAFASTFAYTEAPDVEFLGIFPSSGDRARSVTATVTLGNFPGVTDVTRIAVAFVFDAAADPNGIEASVISFARVDPDLDPLRVQTITVQVSVPCCSDAILEGKVRVQAYHRSYLDRIAKADDAYEYIDSSNPVVTEVLGDNNGPNVKMFTATPVTISLVNVRTTVTESDVVATSSEGVSFPILTLSVQANKDAVMILQAPARSNDGAVSVTLQFPDNLEASFEVVYYDERIPVISQLAPTRGSTLGNTLVFATIANFPIISATSDVTVRFDDIFFGTVVEILSSTETETQLSFLTPEYNQLDAGTRSLPIKITPVAQTSLEVQETFQFFTVDIELESVQPTAGPMEGGTTVKINFLYFPKDTVASSVGVEIDSVAVDASLLSVPISTAQRTQIVMETPPTAPGVKTVRVWSWTRGKGSALSFQFEFIDTTAPAMVQPIPERACTTPTANLNSPTNIFISRFDVSTTPTVTYTPTSGSSSTFTVTSFSPSTATEPATVTVTFPNRAAESQGTVQVASEGKSATFPFEYFDCRVTEFLSAVPSKGINTGGRLVLISVANFDGSGTPTVTFASEIATVDSTTFNADRSQTYIQVAQPSIQQIGEIEVTVTFGSNTVQFPYLLVEACDFDAYCPQQQMIVNVIYLSNAPPLDDTCSIEYCLPASSVPFPIVLQSSPSSGETQGGTLVTMYLQNFIATGLDKVQIQATSGTSVSYKTPSTLETSAWTYPPDNNALSNRATLTYEMPAAPVAKGIVDVVIIATFSGIERSVSVEFEYFQPVLGAPVVKLLTPSRVRASQSTSVFVQLTNFPLVEDVTDTTKVKASVPGKSTLSATSITASTREMTSAYFTLPSSFNLAVGFVNVSFFSSSKAADTSSHGKFEIEVLPDPDPEVGFTFPSNGLSSEQHSIQISIDYFPTGLSTTGVTATMVTDGGASVSLTVSSLAYVDSTCTSRLCSSLVVVVATPVENPDGRLAGGIAKITLCPSSGNVACTPADAILFNYVGENAPFVELVDPATGSGVAGQTTTVEIHVRNFAPVTSEAELRGTLTSGTITFPSAPVEYASLNVTVITAEITSSGVGAVGTGSVYRQQDATNDAAKATFQFTFVTPPPQFRPVDGTSEGGSSIIVSVYWAEALQIGQMGITFGDVAGEVTQIIESITDSNGVGIGWNILVTTPAVPAGIVQVVLTAQGGALSTGFQFEFYDPPSVQDVQPRTATLNGRVADCDVCISDDDGRSVSLWLKNFPAVNSPSDIQIVFRSTVDSSQTVTCDGTSCQVKSFFNAADFVYVTVSVPPWTEPVPVEIVATYTGAAAVPPGGSAAQTYERETKSTSSGTLFSYYRPLPVVLSAEWCQSCNSGTSCIVAGFCANGSSPVVGGGGVLGRVSDKGGGVLTLTVENMGEVSVDSNGLPSGSSLAVSIGNDPATLSRVVLSTDAQLVLEVIPAASSATGVFTSTVAFQPDLAVEVFRTATFSVRIFNSDITLTCNSGCEGSAAGGATVDLSITNFRLEASSLSSAIAVAFGELPATGITLLSSTAEVSRIEVTAPAYTCSACTFVDGQASVSVTVTSTADPSITGDTTFTYYTAPIVTSARFLSSGAGLIIEFDAPTDRAGATASFTCSNILQVTGMGSSPTCQFNSNTQLQVAFGADATIAVGDQISFKANQVLHSSQLSPAVSTDGVVVLQPEILLAPGPITTIGPERIDPCSDLEVVVSLSSPRALTFTWSCPAFEEFDAYLQTVTGSTLALPEGTPRLTAGETYDIYVYATDFLGATSETAVHSVTKLSTAAPTLTFTGRTSYYRTDDVVIRGAAVFSKCPITKSELTFTWTQVSGDSTIPAQYLQSSPQLFIPRNTLNSNSVYTVQLTAIMAHDPSKSTSAIHDIVVLAQDLLAIIDGGSQKKVSEQSALSVSASASRDLDVDATADQGLSFAWECTYTVNGITYNCRDQNSGNLLTMPSSDTVDLAAYALAPDVIYLFTVTVSKDSRTASASSSVFVVSAPIPTISILGTFTSYDAAGRAKLNAYDRLKLQGSSDQPQTSFVWSISPTDGFADASTPAGVVPLGFTKANFALAPRAGSSPAFTQGQVYQVTLTGTVGIHAGSAEFEFVIRTPPTVGTCEACVAGTACTTSGRALLDEFTISCSNWISDELPLTYSFGHRTSTGKDVYTEGTESRTSRSMYLPSGSITLLAVVSDAAGSAADPFEMGVTVTALSFNRRSTSSALLDEVIGILEQFFQLGSVSVVNQLSSAIALEMDAASGVFTNYKTTIVQFLESGLGKAALTSGYAEETVLVCAIAVNNICEISQTTLVAIVNIADQLVDIDTNGVAMTATMAENLVDMMDKITQASLSSTLGGCPTGTSPVSLDSATGRQILETTQEIVRVLGLRLLQDSFQAEPSQDYDAGSCFKVSALRNNAADAGEVSGGAQGSFSLPSSLAVAVGRDDSTVFDLVTLEQCTSDDAGATFNADFVSSHMQHLTLTEEGSSSKTTVQGLSDCITIRIAFDGTAAADVSPFWREKTTCSFYDTASGQMSFDGCTRTAVTDTYVDCCCTHLTGFAATIDGSLPACGDGTITDAEECDDANLNSGDGCSYSDCKIEVGWFCSNAPSECCGPCAAGESRDQCRIQGTACSGTDPCGDCAACAAGKFKGEAGYYNSSCADCPGGTYSVAGASQCTSFATCPAGQQRVNYSVTGEPGSCEQCARGKYKDNTDNTYDKLCSDLESCPAGEYRTGLSPASCRADGSGGGCTTGGRCEACARNSYKGLVGSWYTQCVACPANSGTASTGAVAESECSCNAGWEAPAVVTDSYCVNIDECARGTDNCHANAECTDTQGSFTCACVVPGYTDAGGGPRGVNCIPDCGDGLVYGSEECDDDNKASLDGCSAACAVETNFDCVNGSQTSRSYCACQPTWYSPPSIAQPCLKYCNRVGNGDGECNNAGDCEPTWGYCQCDRYRLGVNCEAGATPFDERVVTISTFNASTVINTGNGDFITIPVGALSSTTTITVDSYRQWDMPPSLTPAASADYQFSGSIIDFRPHGQTFAEDVTLAMTTSGTLGDQQMFAIYYFDRADSSWKQETVPTYDENTGLVSTGISHFSMYAVMIVQIPTTTSSTTTTTPAPTTTSTTTPEPEPTQPPRPDTTQEPAPDTTAPDTTEPPDSPPPPPPDTTEAPTPDTTAAPPPPPPTGGGGGSGIGAIAGGVGAAVAVLIAAAVYWFYFRKRGPAEIVQQPPDQEQPLLAPEQQPASIGTQPIQQFPEDEAQRQREQAAAAAAGASAAAAAAAGVEEAGAPAEDGTWSTCHKCEAPIKSSWPRCPACKESVLPMDKRPVTAEFRPEARPQAGDTEDPQAAAWEKPALGEGLQVCWKCDAPVKKEWPRCPACKAPVLKEGEAPPEEGAAGGMPGALPAVQEESSRPGSAAAGGDFSAQCWQCSAPIKPNWTVCPGCKAPTTRPEGAAAATGAPGGEGAAVVQEEELQKLQQEKEAAGFTKECPNCSAPVKSEWARCPGCKTDLQ